MAHTFNMTYTVDVDIDCLAVVVVKSLYCKDIFYSPFPVFLERNSMKLMVEEGRVTLHLLEGRIFT